MLYITIHNRSSLFRFLQDLWQSQQFFCYSLQFILFRCSRIKSSGVVTFDTMYLTAGGLTSLINGLSIDVLSIAPVRKVQTLLGWQSSPGHLWVKPKLCACVLSRFILVRLFATPWAVAHQAPLSMGFSRQEYWSGLPCPPPGDLPNPEIKPTSPSPPLAGGFPTTNTTWGEC